MTLSFDLNASDYAAFSVYNFRRRKASRSSLRWQQFGYPAAWMLVAALSASQGEYGLLIAMSIASLLWIWGLPAFFRWQIRGRARRLANEGICRGSVGPQRLSVDEAEVLFGNDYYETRTTWRGVDRIEETPDYLFIYLGANAAMIVPTRGQDAGALQQLKSTVERFATPSPEVR